MNWVALGDSYSSGEGVGPFSPGDLCHQSPTAWPRRANEILGGPLGFQSAVRLTACTGATVDDVIDGRLGQPSQVAELEAGEADLATITVGGDDLDFVRIVAGCYLGPCDLDEATAGLPALQDRLVALYRRMQEALPAPERLVVVGYPRITAGGEDFSASTFQCRVLGAAKSQALRDGADLLDQTIHDAADEVGATFADVTDALAHHEVCAGPLENWWIPGITLSDVAPKQLQDLISSASFHPNEEGLQSLAEMVAPVISRVMGRDPEPIAS